MNLQVETMTTMTLGARRYLPSNFNWIVIVLVWRLAKGLPGPPSPKGLDIFEPCLASLAFSPVSRPCCLFAYRACSQEPQRMALVVLGWVWFGWVGLGRFLASATLTLLGWHLLCTSFGFSFTRTSFRVPPPARKPFFCPFPHSSIRAHCHLQVVKPNTLPSVCLT